jgi:amino acid transporter
VLQTSMGVTAVKIILLISSIGQLFCGNACLTSASRMCYAFSRDGAMPLSRIWSRVDARRVPYMAVISMGVVAALITVPAYVPAGNGVPVAFLAVVSIAVIGLYIAYAIPIYLRWRIGDAFEPGGWTNGAKYKWMNPIAVIWVAIVTVVFILPTTPAGVPGNKDFDAKFVNYAPLVTGAVIIGVTVWWVVSARKWFTGPKHTIAELDREVDLAG